MRYTAVDVHYAEM